MPQFESPFFFKQQIYKLRQEILLYYSAFFRQLSENRLKYLRETDSENRKWRLQWEKENLQYLQERAMREKDNRKASLMSIINDQIIWMGIKMPPNRVTSL